MSWSISPGGTFVSLGVSGCVRTLNAGGRDTCEITLAKEAADAADWAEDDEVTVTGPAGSFFVGVVDKISRGASATEQYHTLSLVSKWKWLEEIPYTQTWASGVGSTAIRKSRVVLGIDAAGDRVDTADIINDVLAYANTHSAGITIGSILSGAGFEAPQMEMVDTTCAEVIRSVLRWHPDAVLWFDHANAGTLNITRPSSMAAVSRVAGPAGLCTQIESAPSGALTLRGVQIHYETQNEVDGVTYQTITTDSAGATTGRRIAHFTVVLQGANLTSQQQAVTTENIPMTAGAGTLAAWLTKNFPELAAAAPTAGQLVALDPVQVIDGDGAVGPGSVPGSYNRRLIKGQIHPWMVGVSAAPVVWSIKLKLMAAASANPALAKLFPGSSKIETFSVSFMGTDATTQTYATVSGTGAETPPTGLAAAFFAAFSAAVPSGMFSNVGDNPDVGIFPGVKLSTTGALTITSAPIQSAVCDAFAGTCRGAFGPLNAALAPADMIEILRAGQRSRPLVNYAGGARTSAAASGGGVVIGAGAGRAQSSTRTAAPPTDDFFYVSSGTAGNVAVAAGLILRTSGGAISSQTVAAATVAVADDEKLYLKAVSEGATVTVTYEAHATPPTGSSSTAFMLLAEVSEGPDEERVIKQRHRGILTLPGGSLSAGLLHTQCRKVGANFNIGVTPGIVQCGANSAVPTLEPAGTPMTSAPVYWFADDFPEGTDATLYVYLKIFIADTNDYELYIDATNGAEVHLRTTHPTPIYSASAHQWLWIGSAYVTGGTASCTVASYLAGSLWARRAGGPGCPLDIFTN